MLQRFRPSLLSSARRCLATFQSGPAQSGSWQARQGQRYPPNDDASVESVDSRVRIDRPEAYRTESSSPSSASPMTSSLPFPSDAPHFIGLDQLSLAHQPFAAEVQAILAEPVNPEEVEIKPDGICYLPEMRYRKTLLRAFGPGGWCIVPRGPHAQNGNVLSREYALVCHGRFVAQARGSTAIASFSNAALASEAVRSNALMRCCKDLGIASELWDASYTAAWKEDYGLRRTVTDHSGRPKILWSKKPSE